MRVLFAAAEVFPLAKTGGLADVSRGFTIALRRQGIDAQLILPGYPEALQQIEKPETVARFDVLPDTTDATLVQGLLPQDNVPVWLVDVPSLFNRPGGPYQDEYGRDWADNAERFAAFAHAVHQLSMGRIGCTWRPDVVHANDWHTGLLPLLLSREQSPRLGTVFTAHNMAFQGNFDAATVTTVGLPEGITDDVEFHGRVSFLKAGLRCADRVTTVSPSYAKEVLTPENGCGMDGILRARGSHFSGILNGIEETYWNPAAAPWLPCGYSAKDRSGKGICKLILQREFGLSVNPNAVMIGCVSRLTRQKMADVVLEILPWLAHQPAQMVLMGRGDQDIEADMLQAASQHGGKLAVKVGYDERLAHLLIAGCDILLAPARFEPCGLTQLYALRYGTIPIVRRTGGLTDTITDVDAASVANGTASGFVFDEPDAVGLRSAIDRALCAFRQPLLWRPLQRNAMSRDLGWNASVAKYIALYNEVYPLHHTGIGKAAPDQEIVTRARERSVSKNRQVNG